MLKLEKSSDGSHLSLAMREKECFFNSLFLKALLIALALHLIPYIIFQIHPFTISSTFRYPPVTVFTDFTTKAILQNDHDVLLFDLPPPPLSLMQPKKIESSSELSPTSSSDFINIESLRYMPSMLPKIETTKIKLYISGELAGRPLILKDSLLDEKILIQPGSDPLSIKFRVQVEEKSGTIFWEELILSSGQEKLDALAQKVLSNLRFQVDGSLDQLNGVIDFLIYPEALHD